eukprot:613979-Amphidinium_carterae.2
MLGREHRRRGTPMLFAPKWQIYPFWVPHHIQVWKTQEIHLLAWCSVKQGGIVARSSCEAELLSLNVTYDNSVNISLLQEELGHDGRDTNAERLLSEQAIGRGGGGQSPA